MRKLSQLSAAIFLIMGILFPDFAAAQTPEQSGGEIKVIELRNYLTTPGTRDKFAKFMNEIIIPKQESQGGFVLNQFGLRGRDDNYVWMRGFVDMPARSRFLKDFYTSDYWKQHQKETNSMLVDIEYIYLLKPLVIKEEAVDDEAGVAREPLKMTDGIAVINFFKTDKKREQLIDLFAKEYLPVLEKTGITGTQFWISEPVKNEFWLPAIQDPNLLVTITHYKDETDYKLKKEKADQASSKELKKKIRTLVASVETHVVYPLRGKL
jgi:hypothetical protein